MGNGLVYFVVYDNAAWRATLPAVKIGSTKNLQNRLVDLSIGSPIKLLVAGTIAAKDPYPLEKSFHKAFQRDKLNGEWFKLNPKMLSAIRLHPIIDDRFDELFDLSPVAPDAKDLEIMALRAEISSLNNQLLESGQIAAKSEPSDSYKQVKQRKLIKRCKYGCNPRG